MTKGSRTLFYQIFCSIFLLLTTHTWEGIWWPYMFVYIFQKHISVLFSKNLKKRNDGFPVLHQGLPIVKFLEPMVAE